MSFWDTIRNAWHIFRSNPRNIKSGEDLVRSASRVFENDLGDVSLLTGLDNFFTGNIDYKRSLEAMEKGNQFSANQAQLQRDWDERMANTNYARAIEQAKAYGLNPYVAYSGQGSPTPSFSAPSSVSAQPQKSGSGWGFLGSLLGSVVTAGITSAVKSQIASKQLQAQINRLDKTLDNRWALAEFKSNSAQDLVRLRSSMQPNMTQYYHYDYKGNAYKSYAKFKGRV